MKNILKIFIIALATFVVLTDTDASDGSCKFSSLPYLSATTCFAPTTATWFSYVFIYEPNTNWDWKTASNYAINMLTHVIRTSTWFLMVHNNRVWFAYSWQLIWSDSIGEKWATWATWANWANWVNWATWATWPQGNDWYSAYELAQMNWYTWTIIEWLASLIWPTGQQWATWVIDFSSFTWAINFQTLVQVDSWATLDPNWFYFAITRKKDWVTYIDWIGVRNLTILIAFILIIFAIVKHYSFNNNKWFR